MDLFRHAAKKSRTGQPLAERMRPHELDEFVGQEHLVGPGQSARAHHDAAGAAVDDLVGAAGHRQDDAGAHPGGASARRASSRLSAVQAGVKELREAVAEAETSAWREHARAHGPVHRRDPSLQQGAAGRAAAARRGGHHHADRRDDRESVVRGQRRALVALRVVRLEALARSRSCARCSSARSSDPERGLGKRAARRRRRGARSASRARRAATRGAR